MIAWFTITHTFNKWGRPEKLLICACDTREEGECICQKCWEETRDWKEFMDDQRRPLA